jgi:hypothetical protein
MTTTIVFLGPCYKQDNKTGTLHEPFSERSRSGKFLRSIWSSSKLGSRVQVLFDNIIPRAVFDTGGRERNPKGTELFEHIRSESFWNRLRGEIVVGFSADVRRAFELRENRALPTGEPVPIGGRHFVFLEHPSFMMRQSADRREEYAVRLKACIQSAQALASSKKKRPASTQVARREVRAVQFQAHA